MQKGTSAPLRNRLAQVEGNIVDIDIDAGVLVTNVPKSEREAREQREKDRQDRLGGTGTEPADSGAEDPEGSGPEDSDPDGPSPTDPEGEDEGEDETEEEPFVPNPDKIEDCESTFFDDQIPIIE